MSTEWLTRRNWFWLNCSRLRRRGHLALQATTCLLLHHSTTSSWTRQTSAIIPTGILLPTTSRHKMSPHSTLSKVVIVNNSILRSVTGPPPLIKVVISITCGVTAWTLRICTVPTTGRWAVDKVLRGRVTMRLLTTRCKVISSNCSCQGKWRFRWVGRRLWPSISSTGHTRMETSECAGIRQIGNNNQVLIIHIDIIENARETTTISQTVSVCCVWVNWSVCVCWVSPQMKFFIYSSF